MAMSNSQEDTSISPLGKDNQSAVGELCSNDNCIGQGRQRDRFLRVSGATKIREMTADRAPVLDLAEKSKRFETLHCSQCIGASRTAQRSHRLEEFTVRLTISAPKPLVVVYTMYERILQSPSVSCSMARRAKKTASY